MNKYFWSSWRLALVGILQIIKLGKTAIKKGLAKSALTLGKALCSADQTKIC